MRKLDNRGAAAWEFILVFVPLFTLIFVIFDLGRYAITVQSLHALADAEARAITISNCYINDVIQHSSPCSCATTSNGLSASQQQAQAPFLYVGGLTPTIDIQHPTCGPGVTGVMRVTALQDPFTMIMPIWPASFNAPNVKASTSIPF
jgi:hypothetical protein